MEVLIWMERRIGIVRLRMTDV
ncbi:Bgt-51733 [Blumeria graminis f. sp. tritici]|uniref:Bgt-51733 n=1 Tax=Blumeria graminis f. sp. tritici TaxID=62690 RepID=A0A9X9PQ82_BLUGR|nr:Bgt-51733 [Blumeria graminis f. sp. tritici]